MVVAVPLVCYVFPDSVFFVDTVLTEFATHAMIPKIVFKISDVSPVRLILRSGQRRTEE